MRWVGQLAVIALLVGVVLGAPVVALRLVATAEERTNEAEREAASALRVVALAAGARALAVAYVVLGEPSLREGFDAEVEAVRAELARLRGYGSAIPKIESTAGALERWLLEGPGVFLAMAESGNSAGASALLETGRSAALYAEFEREASELAAELERLAADRREMQRRAALGGFMLFGLGTVAAVLLLAGAARLLVAARREGRAAREAERLALASRERAEKRQALLEAATNELRGPLTALVLAGNILSQEAQTRADESLADLADEIARSIRRLTILVEELLDHTALENDELTLVREEADLMAIVEAAVAEVRAVRSDVAPVIKVTTGNARVVGDIQRLRRALAAFLGAMVRRGSQPERVVISAEGTELCCTLEGTGAAKMGPSGRTSVPRWAGGLSPCTGAGWRKPPTGFRSSFRRQSASHRRRTWAT